MKLVDIIIMLVIAAILVLIFYVTRGKKKDGQCSGCHADCSQCHGVSNLYDAYKKDGMDKK